MVALSGLCCPMVALSGLRRPMVALSSLMVALYRLCCPLVAFSRLCCISSAARGMDLANIWSASSSFLGPLSPPSCQVGSHDVEAGWGGLTSPAA